MSDEQRQRMHQTMQLAFDAPAALTIAETDSSVAFCVGRQRAAGPLQRWPEVSPRK